MATIVALGSRSYAFYDELTNIHLTRRAPRAKVPEGVDLTNLRRAVAVGTVEVVEGALQDPEEKAEVTLPLNVDNSKSQKTEELGNKGNEDEGEKPAMTEEDLGNMFKPELVGIARERGIEGYSSMTKAELVEALTK